MPSQRIADAVMAVGLTTTVFTAVMIAALSVFIGCFLSMPVRLLEALWVMLSGKLLP